MDPSTTTHGGAVESGVVVRATHGGAARVRRSGVAKKPLRASLSPKRKRSKRNKWLHQQNEMILDKNLCVCVS